ncbi:MAG: hypothetical protein MUF23_03930 [Pirellula sp.]|nr:hypothetical protein [Pirellula sp.]
MSNRLFSRAYSRLARIGRVGMVLALLVGMAAHSPANENVATHKQTRSIAPHWKQSPVPLHTFCVGPDQLLYMCCSGSGAPTQAGAGVILVYTGEGALVREIPLEFVPQAINFGENGKCFVAGSGKLARLSSEGDIEIVKDAPNIGNPEQMAEELKKAAEEQKKMVTESYTQQLEQIDTQLRRAKEENEKADPADEKGAKKRQRRLKMLEQQRDQWDGMLKQIEESFAAQGGDAILQQMKRATGLAVSKQDVFVSLPKATGYGYSIHRLDHDLENATVVLENVGGCCGQLDIQSDGENLLIAENTSFKVSIYNRDGKRQDSWGQRGRDKVDGFGSCCNPMNVRCCENGEILTAESSIGDIKRFSKDGKFLGLIGRASVGGGCKHVAIGWDSDRDWHYMMNQDKSSVAVLVPKKEAPEETEDERATRMAMEGLGRKWIGTWEIAEVNSNQSGAAGAFSMDSYINQSYGHLEFAGDGSLIARPYVKTQPAKEPKPESQETDGASEKKGVIGALAAALGLDGSSEVPVIEDDGRMAAMVLNAAQRKSTWKALAQRDNELDFVMVEDDVQSYGATVRWINDEEVELMWFYGSPESKVQNTAVRYKRVSRDACGQKCDGEQCESKNEAVKESVK